MAGGQCLQLAGWLLAGAGWLAGLPFLLCFALLCFALLCFALLLLRLFVCLSVCLSGRLSVSLPPCDRWKGRQFANLQPGPFCCFASSRRRGQSLTNNMFNAPCMAPMRSVSWFLNLPRKQRRMPYSSTCRIYPNGNQHVSRARVWHPERCQHRRCWPPDFSPRQLASPGDDPKERCHGQGAIHKTRWQRLMPMLQARGLYLAWRASQRSGCKSKASPNA